MKIKTTERVKNRKLASDKPGNYPLLSWNNGKAKKAIIDFVNRVTDEDGDDFVPEEERIATLDNDGTLWAEYPMYFQLLFAIDRVHALAPMHPEWKEKLPFKAILEGDVSTALAGGKRAIEEIVMITHADMSTNEFNNIVKKWIKTAKHPHFNKLYTECIYQPMLELMIYLRANKFKTYIVSGGGIEFMRPWVEEIYGIPPEQVIGSSIKTKYELKNGKPVLTRIPELNFFDDGAQKPVGINEAIGRKPIAAFGNSDGDFEMLEWVSSRKGLSFGMLIHHDDHTREWKYDRQSKVGKLDKGLDEADKRGWVVVSMKNDWKDIFPTN